MGIQAVAVYSDTGNGTGAIVRDAQPGATFQATITGTGAVAASVLIQGSLDVTNWADITTISLSGSTSDNDFFVSTGQWVAYRVVVSGSTGTISSIKVSMSEVT